jgi:serine/threonine protein kinase
MTTRQNSLERYTILHELGHGAIGRVHAARDRLAGAVVALKTFDPALSGEAKANVGEILKNARSAARLRHRNIVKVHDVGEAAGTAYVAMELIKGESLRSLLDKGPLPIARAIQIFDDIASALAYAHEEGMLHRGVKPSNIIVLRSGVAKISDFGSGHVGEAALRYMSPEQVRGDPVDPRSDLFSLGVVFYEMLTRQAPFEGNSAKAIMENILHAEPPLPSKVNPHVPFALDRIVFTMLAGHPDDRFANARILLRDLQRLEEELGLGPGASAVAGEPAASVPAERTEPKLRTPEPNRPEPELRAPESNRSEPTLRIPDGEAFAEHDARFMRDRAPEPRRSSGSRAARFAALALLLVAVPVGLAVFWYYSPGASEPRTLASRVQETPAAAPAPSPSPAPAPAAPEPLPVPPQPLAAEPSPPAPAESLPAREPEQPARTAAAPAKAVPPPTVQRTASTSKSQPAGTAKLTIAVSPRGELYIDGEHYGTTPPVTTLDLEPGMYRIEIRSGSRKPYLTYMAVQAGEQRRIRHDFSARSSRPPT